MEQLVLFEEPRQARINRTVFVCAWHTVEVPACLDDDEAYWQAIDIVQSISSVTHPQIERIDLEPRGSLLLGRRP